MKLIVLILALLTMSASAQNPVYRSNRFTLYPDRVVEGSAEARAVSSTELVSSYPFQREDSGKHWKLNSDLSSYPALRSQLPLLDAVYNLSLEELTKDVRTDNTFMAGAQWGGVWTRDISYSIVLSLAAIAPDISKKSLLAKVKRDRIVQDTGTGGSWPVSSDRMTWALAAWEIYKVTGDRDWLKQSYQIIRNSAADDAASVLAAPNGLARGESSFLDWREQTYPRWMDATDIYSAQALGTNAVHYQTYRILAQMAKLLGEPAEEFDKRADRIRTAMNRLLWMEDKGYYGQYLYGREWMSISPRAESLGESLTMLFDIATPQQQIRMLKSLPVTDYGVSSVSPQTPGIPPYHNDAVWPFVQAYWNLAAAKNSAGPIVSDGMALLLRNAALFLTNKENLVASTGSPQGTQINSDRQLWSVAGNLATVYRLIFGLNFSEEGLTLTPFIPKEWSGRYDLENLRYREAVLSLHVEGYGTKPTSMLLDGKPFDGKLPKDMRGQHHIEIVLSGTGIQEIEPHRASIKYAPETPRVQKEKDRLVWMNIEGAHAYRIYRNAKLTGTVQTTEFPLTGKDKSGEYQVSAVDNGGDSSFLSEPVTINDSEMLEIPFAGAADFLDLAKETPTAAHAEAQIAHEGTFRIQLRYANGAGPIITDNQCGLRSLYVDGRFAGVLVMPQRGQNAWDNWGTSSALSLSLAPGKHRFELRMEEVDENMNVTHNRVRVSRLLITPVRP